MGPLWLAFLLVPAASVCATSAAMLGHEGSHRSFSKNPARNHLLNYITFPLLGGLSALYWRNKHDGGHHGHPNVVGEDPDIGLWPMTSCQENHLKSNALRRWFQRNLQGVMFWPLTLLLPLMMRFMSVKYLTTHVRRHGLSFGWVADVASLVAHYTLWLVVPSLIWGFAPAILVYGVLWTIVGGLLALIFAPAHMGLPVVVEQNNDWQHHLETTRNLVLPRPLRYFFIGLDYQVEHHLFPKIPHQELPRAAEITKAWCARVGVPHQEITYGAAVVDVTRFMHNAWKHPAQTGAQVRGTVDEPTRAAA
jgi:fatty acid desaturase